MIFYWSHGPFSHSYSWYSLIFLDLPYQKDAAFPWFSIAFLDLPYKNCCFCSMVFDSKVLGRFTSDNGSGRPLSGISTHGSRCVAESFPLRPPQCRGLIRQTGSPGGTKKGGFKDSKFLDGSMKSKKILCISIYLSVCLSIYRSIYPSIYLSI